MNNLNRVVVSLVLAIGMSFGGSVNAQVLLAPGSSVFTTNPLTQVSDIGLCPTCVFGETFTATNGNFTGTMNYGALLNDGGAGFNPFDPSGTLGYLTFAVYIENDSFATGDSINQLTFNDYAGVDVAVGYNPGYVAPTYFSRSGGSGNIIDINTLSGFAPGMSELLFLYTNSTTYFQADLLIQDNGQATATVFAPVPEPETYAMMLVGLGLMGFIARRRMQKDAAA